MSDIGYILEKVEHGSAVTTGEAKTLSEMIQRVTAKLEGCAQELARREEADGIARQADKARAEKLRLCEEEGERMREALEFSRRQRSVETGATGDKIIFLEGILRDIHYGLLYQPEITREELASVIAQQVTPHRKPLD